MRIIDSSLWIDFTRLKSPKKLKQFISPYILDPQARTAEPIRFEVLRHATHGEIAKLEEDLQIHSNLDLPDDLWSQAAKLGQACRAKNYTVKPFDLLISAIAIHHDAEVVTFDSDFVTIAGVSKLRVQLLMRPTP